MILYLRVETDLTPNLGGRARDRRGLDSLHQCVEFSIDEAWRTSGESRFAAVLADCVRTVENWSGSLHQESIRARRNFTRNATVRILGRAALRAVIEVGVRVGVAQGLVARVSRLTQRIAYL
jgi:hypothetical protein